MRTLKQLIIATALGALAIPASAQDQAHTSGPKVVVVTGARFSYQLVEKWIEDYSRVNPNVQIIVESRGTTDPLKYDILAEVYQQPEEFRKTREYINVGRYAILPVATRGSSFARYYSEKGFDKDLIKQIFFHDIFADQSRQKEIKARYQVYTRLQKAGVPSVFAAYFGHDQKDITGTSVAGSDIHLQKAVLRDSVGVTYLPLPLIFDSKTRKPVEGLTVLPVDISGNGKVNEEETFYGDLDQVIARFESEEGLKNIPVEYLHLSVDRQKASPEAIDFLKWVNDNGQADLHTFGYLKPAADKFEKEKFNEFASRKGR